jgi:hypothetical protein
VTSKVLKIKATGTGSFCNINYFVKSNESLTYVYVNQKQQNFMYFIQASVKIELFVNQKCKAVKRIFAEHLSM